MYNISYKIAMPAEHTIYNISTTIAQIFLAQYIIKLGAQ